MQILLPLPEMSSDSLRLLCGHQAFLRQHDHLPWEDPNFPEQTDKEEDRSSSEFQEELPYDFQGMLRLLQQRLGNGGREIVEARIGEARQVCDELDEIMGPGRIC
ncbi:MAG: hypothetical protein WDN67_01300 [Candidatus Moraniibacteriota bacterium]